MTVRTQEIAQIVCEGMAVSQTNKPQSSSARNDVIWYHLQFSCIGQDYSNAMVWVDHKQALWIEWFDLSNHHENCTFVFSDDLGSHFQIKKKLDTIKNYLESLINYWKYDAYYILIIKNRDNKVKSKPLEKQVKQFYDAHTVLDRSYKK